ncbi:MAG: phenylalanine--tRNA ligase subunit beta, partial [Deltaproteobacteria bacterium]|nr:phenylalanine--tRNA ligase subunit beta [Deltaproteobacteria bacterium]
DDGRDCPRYTAMCFTGVRILPSPFRIRHRLRTVGLRPISNVVDLTNYVMVAIGEPTHAFDRRQIGGDTIRVRRARPGERMRTLDGADHELTAEDLLIADANRGVALAGVMGGENSEILPDTAEMVLEAATFHPGRIRRTAVRHGIRTDSSARGEKSLDPAFCPRAVSMFASMLPSVSPGARPSSRVYDVAVERKPLHVALHPAYVSRRLGIEVPPGRTAGILSSLGFAIAEQPDGAFDVTVPSWRATRDVSIPEDLVEEVGRVIGYDQVPPAGPLVAVTLVPRHPPRALAGRVRRVLSLSCGLDEVRTYSFDSEPLLRKIGLAAGPVRLRNPISADMTTLRTALATGLLGAMERNATRYADFGIFEVGRVFQGEHDADGVPVQPQRVAILLYDRAAKSAEGAEALMRRLRGVLDHLLDRLDRGRPDLSEEGMGPHAGLPWVAAGGSAAVNVAGAAQGYVTRVHPAVMKALDCAGVAVVAEIDLGALLAAPEAARTWAPVPRFPSIQADVSFVADQRLKAGDLDRIVRANAGDLLAGVDLVAVYSGAPIPEGSRSLSFRMTFLAPDRTLSDAEVKAAVDRVVAAARDAGATIRE